MAVLGSNGIGLEKGIRALFKLLRKLTTNPLVNVLVGVIFIVSGGYEIVVSLEETEGGSIGAHHGAVVFGLLHALRHFPDMVEGAEYLERSRNG